MPDAIAAADIAACRAMLRTGSRSFFMAGLLLPRRVMRPATALYAFCRVADDLVDGQAAPERKLAALDGLRRRLDLVYAGMPIDAPADRALAAVVQEHRMPRALLDALLEGFAWDAAGRRYDSLAELEDYAARVAGTVGAMMAVLMGARDPDVVGRACDLGIAMQLSNIARDVGEDARAGRLYLPQRWMRDAGVDPDRWLQDPAFSPALGGVVRRLVATADLFYARSDAGVSALPLRCRPGIGAARRLYSAIGHRVAASGGNSVETRAVVPAGQKLRLLGAALAASVTPAVPVGLASTPAARHLVSAVASSPVPRPRPARLVWLIELFADLDQRQAGASAGRPSPL